LALLVNPAADNLELVPYGDFGHGLLLADILNGVVVTLHLLYPDLPHGVKHPKVATNRDSLDYLVGGRHETDRESEVNCGN
jgi:hypothetical protein